MSKRLWTRFGVGAALAFSAWTGAAEAQSALSDPWGRVPALPTGCYFDDADVQRFDAAQTAIAAEHTRQSKINDEIRRQFAALDPMAQAQRMQAYMMRNPQKAAEMLQGIQATAATATSQAVTSSTEGPKLDQELDAVHARYRTEVNTLLKPIDDRAAAFFASHSERGEAGPYIPKKADEAQYNAIMQERNTAYDRMCASYWGASGSVHAWFSRYKAFLVNEAKSYDAADAAAVTQMQIMETPTGGYRSVSALDAARRYAEKARSVLALRPGKDLTTGWTRP